jgi:hypothetical protein
VAWIAIEVEKVAMKHFEDMAMTMAMEEMAHILLQGSPWLEP